MYIVISITVSKIVTKHALSDWHHFLILGESNEIIYCFINTIQSWISSLHNQLRDS